MIIVKDPTVTVKCRTAIKVGLYSGCDRFAMSLSTSISHCSDNARHRWPS